MSSDEKALMELMQIMGGLPIPQMVYEWVIKTRQEAREEERKIILGLPCMKELETWSTVVKEGEKIRTMDGEEIIRNSFRRELKEEINKNI